MKYTHAKMTNSPIQLLLIAFLLSTSTLFSQKYNYEFGNVTLNELKAKVYPKDRTAGAVVISDYAYRTIKTADYRPWTRAKFAYKPKRGYARERFYGLFNYVIETSHQRKIKIFNKEGLNKATVKISYHNKKDEYQEELIKDVEAWTYHLENGEIQKTKLDAQKITSVENGTVSEIIFTFPNVAVGDVVEYRYRRISPLYVGMPNWSFQQDMPVMSALLEVFLYDAFQYNMLLKGDFEIQKQAFIEHPKLNDLKQSVFDGRDAIRTIFLAGNLPAIKEEIPYLWNIDEHRSAIDFELRSTKFLGYIPYADKWKDVEERIETETKFNKLVYGKDFYKKEIKELIKPLETEKEKVEAIYQFIKNKVKWNGKYALYADPKTTFEKGEGTNVDINTLLLRALKSAKIYVYPVLLCPKNEGTFPKEKPTFNKIKTFVVCVSLRNGQSYYMDGSAYYGGLNMLPPRLMPNKARTFVRSYDLLDGQSNATIDMGWINSFKTITHIEATLDATNNLLKGKAITEYHGLSALETKQNFAKTNNPQQWQQNIQTQNNIKISDYRTDKTDDLLSNIISETYNFDKEIDRKDGILQFNPLVLADKLAHYTIDEQRFLPVEFLATRQQEINIELTLPANIEVIDIPSNSQHKLEDGSVQFSYSTNQTGSTVQIKYNFQIAKPTVAKEHLNKLRELFEAIQRKNSELVKIRK